jgi:hypothetical protein
MSRITTAINHLLKVKYNDRPPMAINCGLCHDFAYDVISLAECGNIVVVADHCHSIVHYKNKYYDSESPNGVDNVDDIPYVKRLNKDPVQKCPTRQSF